MLTSQRKFVRKADIIRVRYIYRMYNNIKLHKKKSDIEFGTQLKLTILWWSIHTNIYHTLILILLLYYFKPNSSSEGVVSKRQFYKQGGM